VGDLLFHCYYVPFFYRFRDIAIFGQISVFFRRLATPISFKAIVYGVFPCDLGYEIW